MSDTLATVTSDDGFSVESTYETQEQLTEGLKDTKPADGGAPVGGAVEPDKDDEEALSEAAAKLGEKGGKASAAKRAEAQGQPEGEKPEDAPAATDKDRRKGNPRHDPTARVAEATREAKEAREALAAERAERERLSREMEALRSGKPAEAKPEKPAEKVDGRPKVEDFATYEEFIFAAAEYNAEQKIKAFEERAAKEREQAARSERINSSVTAFQGRLKEAAKADPTFYERTAAIASKLQPSFTLAPNQQLGPLNVAADEIIKSAQSAALLAYLADNEDAVSALESLSSIPDVQAEIRFIAKGLTAAPTATALKPEISKAKPPIRPVVGAPASSSGPDPDSEDNFEEWVDHYNAKERRS